MLVKENNSTMLRLGISGVKGIDYDFQENLRSGYGISKEGRESPRPRIGASRTRDTVVFQIHRARPYTKCPQHRSRVSQDVKGSSLCEGVESTSGRFSKVQGHPGSPLSSPALSQKAIHPPSMQSHTWKPRV